MAKISSFSGAQKGVFMRMAVDLIPRAKHLFIIYVYWDFPRSTGVYEL